MAMKRYIFTLALGVVLSFTQCTMNDIDVNVAPTPSNSGLHIIGAAADFENVKVGTRAAEEVYPDSFISEMTMFVFDSNDNLLQGLDANQNPISSAINIPQSNPTFLIEAKKYNGTGIISSMGASLSTKYFRNTGPNLAACSIYIVANAYHQISHLIDSDDSNGEIKDLDDLKDAILSIDNTLSMPVDINKNHIGFPMIGHAITPDENIATFDLRYGTNTETNAVANIPLIKLYSKVYFAIQINSNQVVADGPTPKFTIDRAEVYNVPTQARMGTYSDEYITELGNEYQFTSEPFVIRDSFSNKTIYHTASKDITIGLGSSDLIEFYFYMPEHKVTKNNINPYPANLPSDRKQYYKPKLVGAGSDGTGLAVNAKTATFVRIYGSYTDHNGRIKNVSYDVYLGQNEIDDFEVKRNQQLINYLVITGTTNHKDAYFGGNPDTDPDNISIDHRVTITDRGYNVYMEREAILDSHFEVRPVDFELQNGSALTIVIPEDYQSWIAMESDAVAKYGSNKNLYIDNTNEKRGVRKYFTTNLVSELTNVGRHEIPMNDGRKITTNATKGTITLEHSSRLGGSNTDTEHFRVWFYIDENPNVYDKTGTGKQTSETGDYTVSKTLYRNAPVKLYYTNIATNNPDIDSEAVHTINFQQWNLWRVWSADRKRYYDIEHEEEYLNNYASDQQYGGTQNGMPWGLEGIQLSHQHDAAVLNTTDTDWLVGLINIFGYIFSGGTWSVESYYNSAFQQLENKPLYDFYLPRDTSEPDLVTHEYNGFVFNQEIAATLKAIEGTNSDAKISRITLTEDPKSAFAYCYHKNKRDGNGNVEEQKWFLPAIDEIEDIALGAYDEFDRVFQNKEYWSCQPAYDKVLLSMPIKIVTNSTRGTLTADYYIDDLDRARATSVYTTDGKNYQNIKSGVPGYAATQHGEAKNTTIKMGEFEKHTLNYDNDNSRGNLPRTQKCRIRAVYRSGKIE